MSLRKTASSTLHLRRFSAEDRLMLVVRGSRPTRWWLTRRLAVQWIGAWQERLAKVPPPELPASVVGVPTRLSPADEHRLALELDPALPSEVQGASALPPENTPPVLLRRVTLTVSSTGTLLRLAGAGQQARLGLTRRDSHRVLHALWHNVQAMQWLSCPDWPAWLLEGRDVGSSSNPEG